MAHHESDANLHVHRLSNVHCYLSANMNFTQYNAIIFTFSALDFTLLYTLLVLNSAENTEFAMSM